jgi:hypothetical protein
MKYAQSSKFSVFMTLAAAFLMVGNALAQELERAVPIDITGEDRIAAALTSGIRYHLLLTPQAKAKGISADSPNVKLKSQTTVHPPATVGFYPDDVAKQSSTGKTVVNAAQHPIYINCAASCWGTPATFLTNLDASTMIHIADQYTDSTANGRYTVGTQFSVTVTIYSGTSGVPTLGENDILGIVHAAAKIAGTGYSHIYHVFIPKGVDTCMDEGPCYSPDNANSFVFCAYHFTVKFADLASPVYYTVEPYQGPLTAPLLSCAIPFSTPNGALIDSTATTLLHETFETITDPDIITGYRAAYPTGNGGEVGDLCDGVLFNPQALNGKNYAVQGIYSNTYHACVDGP